MSWYRDGVITLTNGSKTVTGAGTAWLENVVASSGLKTPTGTEEIESVSSNGMLQLVMPYTGPTVNGVAYAIIPTQGLVPALTKKVTQLLSSLGVMKDDYEAGNFLDLADLAGKVDSSTLLADDGANAVKFRLAATAAVARTLGQILSDLWVNVKSFGAKGDEVQDDWPAITSAQAFASLNGGGNVYFPQPVAGYLISKPIEMLTGVNLIGASQRTRIRKTSTTAGTGGIDCVVFGNSKSRFKIENLELRGNRVRSNNVVSVTTHGLYLRDCSYFDVANIRAVECKRGFVYETCFVCGLSQATAQQCQEYGFTLRNANTSTVLRTTIAWGCGGGWDLEGCIYTQLIGCACDHSDAGGRTDDPFLPSGSGGNYQDPNFIFRFSGCQGITVVSPGMENGYSKYLYAEGSQVTFVTPYIYNIECHSANAWFLFHIAGTGTSNITLINPWGFGTAINKLAAQAGVKGIYIEQGAKQRLEVMGNLRIDPSFGVYSYPPSGLVYTSGAKVVDYTQYNLAVGQSSSFTRAAADVASVIQGSAEKLLEIRSVSANVANFDQLLPGTGLYQFKANGTYSSSFGTARLALVETNGTTTNTLRSWTNSGNTIAINDTFAVSVTAGYRLLLRITTNHTTDVMRFSNLEITWVTNQ